MKVKYIGETKETETVSGKNVKLEKGMELECMEKEYHSATLVRATMTDGERVKVRRGELQKV